MLLLFQFYDKLVVHPTYNIAGNILYILECSIEEDQVPDTLKYIYYLPRIVRIKLMQILEIDALIFMWLSMCKSFLCFPCHS